MQKILRKIKQTLNRKNLTTKRFLLFYMKNQKNLFREDVNFFPSHDLYKYRTNNLKKKEKGNASNRVYSPEKHQTGFRL